MLIVVKVLSNYSGTCRTTDSITDPQQPLPTLSRSSTASMLECLGVEEFVKDEKCAHMYFLI